MGFRAENKQSRKQQRQWKSRVRRQNRKKPDPQSLRRRNRPISRYPRLPKHTNTGDGIKSCTATDE